MSRPADEEALPASAILSSPAPAAPERPPIGCSRKNRPIHGYILGTGPVRISLIAGCHADEPVGPLTLQKLIAFFQANQDHPLLSRFQFWIVPDVNPDGALRNAAWSERVVDDCYDIASYLTHVNREVPGDDIEFGFPGAMGNADIRPEPKCVYEWWTSSESDVVLHASLHGLSMGRGPWFLIDPDWVDRSAPLMSHCMRIVDELGYSLHDVQRNGEKGFTRIAPGFCTRPNHLAMRAFFNEQDNPEMASRFQRSSMEAIKDFGDSPLTLVSEVPLFITPPSLSDHVPDRESLPLRREVSQWSTDLANGRNPEDVSKAACEAGLRAFPIRDQMRIQLAFIQAGINLIDAPYSPQSS